METQTHRRLSELASGRRARIAAVEATGALGQRLLELGLLEGTTVEMIRRAPAGDPVEIRVWGSLLSLRVAEAERITVEEL